MKNCRHYLLALLFLAISAAATAQTLGRINSVAHSPNPAYNGNAVNALLNVNIWSSCEYFNTSYVFQAGNNTLTVYLDFNVTPGICMWVVTQTNLNVPLGNLNAGYYTVNFYDWDNNTYLSTYNFTVNGGGGGGPNGCNNPVQISCGNTYYGNNAGGVYNWTSYSGAATFYNMTGPEVIHTFTLTTTSNVTITLGGFYGDLDLMMHTVCSNAGIIDFSGNQANQSEQIVRNNVAPGTYRVIVDGYAGTISNYYLSLSCNAIGCSAPALSQLSVTGIGQYNATLNCSVTGMSSYQFRYKPTSGTSWTILPTSSSNTAAISGLVACSNYEFQCRVYCNNNWSIWSPSKTFSTLCTPACVAPTASQVFASYITATSAQLNCTASGLYYAWAYRVAGGTWIYPPTTITNYTTITGLLPNTTYQFAVAVYCSDNTWSEWSPIMSFTTSSASLLCDNAVSLGCGSVYSGSTWGYSNNFSYYGCSGWNESGNERIFKVVLNNYSSLTATLSNMGAFDGDVFILGSCSNSNCLTYGNDVASLQLAAPGTYYIVVDGYNGQNGNFTLTVSCSGGGVANDEPCGATVLQPGSSCVPVSSTTVGATQTQNPSPYTVTGGCSITGMKDVWFKFVMPSTEKVYFQTFAGNLTDAVIAGYSSENCSSFGNSFGCLDNSANGNPMPSGAITAPAGTTVYIRLWGKNGTTGTFSICLQTATTFGGDGGGESQVTPEEATTDRADTDVEVETPLAPEPVLTLFPVPARDRISVALELPADAAVAIRLFDLTGKMVKEISEVQAEAGAFLQELEIADLPNGTYMAQVQAGDKVLTAKFLKVE